MRRNLAVVVTGLVLPPAATVGLLLLNRALSLSVGIYKWDHRQLLAFVCVVLATPVLGVAWAILRVAGVRTIAGWVGGVGLLTASSVCGVVFAGLAINVATDQGYELLRPVLLGATLYSDGYSEDGWSRIRVGTPRDAVRRLVGEPLYSVQSGTDEIWTYSGIGDYQSRAEKGFHLRRLVIREQTVSAIIERYLTADQVNPVR